MRLGRGGPAGGGLGLLAARSAWRAATTSLMRLTTSGLAKRHLAKRLGGQLHDAAFIGRLDRRRPRLAGALVEKGALPAVLASFIFNFGSVIAISALMLTYLNYAPEPVTISAKLMGISMVSALLILGLAGVWVYHTNPGIDEHSLVTTFITLVLLSSLLIILIFPRFFRTALLDPLEKLSRGVKIANEGDLNVQVAVQYDDEIGFLTRSFNRMISSLNEATRALKNESAILERQVADRTAELQEINQQLISENLERKHSEARLDRQLRYEQALAICSQTLLITTDGEESQQRVLNQALEHLRAGVQASRAYVFRNFPVIQPKLSFAGFTLGPAVLLEFAVLAALYPLLRIRKLHPVEAMHAV